MLTAAYLWMNWQQCSTSIPARPNTLSLNGLEAWCLTFIKKMQICDLQSVIIAFLLLLCVINSTVPKDLHDLLQAESGSATTNVFNQ